MPHLRNRLFSFVWLNNRLHCLVTTLCLTLWDSMDCSPPGSSVHEISQRRILEWVAIPPPGDLPKLGIECTSASPELGGRFFTLSHLGSQGSSCKWAVNNSCLMGIQVPSQESFWPQKLCGVLPEASFGVWRQWSSLSSWGYPGEGSFLKSRVWGGAGSAPGSGQQSPRLNSGGIWAGQSPRLLGLGVRLPWRQSSLQLSFILAPV